MAMSIDDDVVKARRSCQTSNDGDEARLGNVCAVNYGGGGKRGEEGLKGSERGSGAGRGRGTDGMKRGVNKGMNVERNIERRVKQEDQDMKMMEADE